MFADALTLSPRSHTFVPKEYIIAGSTAITAILEQSQAKSFLYQIDFTSQTILKCESTDGACDNYLLIPIGKSVIHEAVDI